MHKIMTTRARTPLNSFIFISKMRINLVNNRPKVLLRSSKAQEKIKSMVTQQKSETVKIMNKL